MLRYAYIKIHRVVDEHFFKWVSRKYLKKIGIKPKEIDKIEWDRIVTTNPIILPCNKKYCIIHYDVWDNTHYIVQHDDLEEAYKKLKATNSPITKAIDVERELFEAAFTLLTKPVYLKGNREPRYRRVVLEVSRLK